MSHESTLDTNIVAIIVLYNPVYKNLQAQKKALPNIDFIYVDNSKEPIDIEDNFKHIKLNNNTGIAHAQNIGILEAQKTDKYKYILFLDQDSILSKAKLFLLHQQLEKIRLADPKAIAIGPNWVDRRIDAANNPMYELLPSEVNYHRVNMLISSGSLIDITAFDLDKIGLYNKSFFIDAVDTEWCYRAISKKFNIYLITNVYLKHELGGVIKNKILNKYIHYHPPYRYGYVAQNYIKILLNPNISLKLKLRTLIAYIKTAIRMVLIPEKKKSLICFIKGSLFLS